MTQPTSNLIDWSVYSETRSSLGVNFLRILGYFREDGTQSVTQIEEAIRNKDATQLVMPANTLKSEASQFGAIQLSAVAEKIEMVGRKCIERHETPDELLELVVSLRPMFEETLSEFERESNPLVPRHQAGIQRRYGGFAA